MPKETDILLDDLSQTKQECDKNSTHVEDLDSRVDKAIKLIAVPKTVSDNISKIDDDLKRLSDILVVLSIVPMVDFFAGPAKISVDDANKVIHPIRLKANEFDSRAKPVREKLKKINSKVKQAIESLKDLKKTAGELYNTVEITDTCAKRQGRNPISLLIAAFSKKINPGVKEANSILILSDRIIKEIDSALFGFSDELTEISSFEKIIVAFQKEVDSLSSLLTPIQNILNKEINITYDVKIKDHIDKDNLEQGWKAKTINFEFTVRKILNGVNTGISKVDEELDSSAKEALESVNIKMSKLCTIPGINDLSEKISDAVGSVDGIETKLDQLECDLDKITQKTKDMKDNFDSFDIICA